MTTPDEIDQMIADCEKREGKLSDWERGYLDSLSVQLGRGQALTPKQDAKLTEIWDRVTG
ncbi:MAG: hypothetical protein WEE89_07200 [Gemmatimonadota bacterium]